MSEAEHTDVTAVTGLTGSTLAVVLGIGVAGEALREAAQVPADIGDADSLGLRTLQTMCGLQIERQARVSRRTNAPTKGWNRPVKLGPESSWRDSARTGERYSEGGPSSH